MTLLQPGTRYFVRLRVKPHFSVHRDFNVKAGFNKVNILSDISVNANGLWNDWILDPLVPLGPDAQYTPPGSERTYNAPPTRPGNVYGQPPANFPYAMKGLLPGTIAAIANTSLNASQVQQYAKRDEPRTVWMHAVFRPTVKGTQVQGRPYSPQELTFFVSSWGAYYYEVSVEDFMVDDPREERDYGGYDPVTGMPLEVSEAQRQAWEQSTQGDPREERDYGGYDPVTGAPLAGGGQQKPVSSGDGFPWVWVLGAVGIAGAGIWYATRPKPMR